MIWTKPPWLCSMLIFRGVPTNSIKPDHLELCQPKSFDIGQLWDIAWGSISLLSLGFLFVSFLNWYLDITARCHFACCQAPRLPVPFCHPWVLMDDIRVSWRRRAQIQDVHPKINGWNLQPSPMKRKEIDLNQTSAITSFQFNITKNVPC